MVDLASPKAYLARLRICVAFCSRGLRSPCRGRKELRFHREWYTSDELRSCRHLCGSGVWLGVSRHR
jgi:hypothetical protein